MNKYVRKGLKISAWTVGSVIGLFLLLVLLIQLPSVQDYLRGKAVKYLEEKIKTPVRIDRIEIGLPKKVIVEGIYLQDQKGDTLILGEKIALDIDLFKLMSNEVQINSVDLKGINANVTRSKDSIFNFDYIIKAFDSGKPKDPDAKPMKISIKDVNLDRIKVHFDDAISKNDLEVSLHHFDTKITKFDLDKSKFDVPKITMDGLRLKLKQGELVREIGEKTVEVADSLAQNPGVDIKLGEIDFTRIAIGYDNVGTNLNSGLTLKKLRMKFNKTDIRKQTLDISAMQMNGLKGGFTLGKTKVAKINREVDLKSKATTTGWNVKLAQADLSDIDFRFDDQNATPVKKGIDYKHLGLSGFNLKATRLSYNPEVVSGNVQSLKMRDKSGVVIEQLQTEFYYGPTQAFAKNLYLKTPKTEVRDKLIAGYPSLESLKENPGELALDADLKNSKIAFEDVLLFVPTLEQTNPFKDNPKAVVFINGKLKGKLKDLSIPNLEVSGIGNTKIAASGRIVGLPDVKNARFDLDIKQVQTTAKDIYSFVPKGTIPESIALPSKINLAGTFKGSAKNMNANLDVKTSFGNAKVKGFFDGRVKNREKYNADVAFAEFDLGKLIKNDSIGKISLKAKVVGTGLDPKTAVAKLDGKLQKAEFNGYTYKNLNLKGDIKNGRFNAVADMSDPNLTFDLVSSGNFKDKYPSNVKLKLNVDIADLDKLNLHAGPMKLKGKVEADMANTNPDMLNGKVSAYHFVIANEKEQFQLDSIHATAESTEDSTKLNVKSQFLKAEMNGKFKLTKVGTALSNTIAKYYTTKPKAEARQEDVRDQSFAFKADVHNDPVLQKLVPELTRLEPIHIEGGYDSANDSISVQGTIPRLVYAENTISGGVIDIRTEKDSIVYNFNIDNIENERFQLPDTNINGSVKNNTVTYNLVVRDLKGKEHYRIAGDLKAVDQINEIHLDPNGLTLNYDPWTIAPENEIKLGNAGVNAQNFELSREGSSIRLQSAGQDMNAPVDVTFTDFKIGTITKMVSKETKDGFSVGGNLNGKANLKDLRTNPVFTSDLTIDNLTVSKDTVGNVNIKVDNTVANTYRADVTISGNENDVKLNGNYNSASKTFDLDLDMNRLQMTSVQAFTMGKISKSSGYLSGKLKITGSPEDPNINGDLYFNDAKFTITELNSALAVEREKISFTDEGIAFDNFSFKDEENNTLNINGRVLTQNYRDYGFDLKIRANDFRAVNSTQKDNDLFYGKLYFDTRLDVSGDLNQPVVTGSVKINEKTDFTVVLPQPDPGIADREGIVEFIDVDNPDLNEKLMTAADSLSTSKFRGMDVDVNIEINKEAKLSLVIDKGNGDYLELKGEARLNGGIDPSGKTSLTGRYELKEGFYQMSFNLIKRKFEIADGSYILWTGEPTTADINITAIYTANTAPIDLVGNQLGAETTASMRNTYKQRLPFQAKLMMKGQLLKPEISFDIDLPDKNYGVSSDIVDAARTKLAELRQDPAELNKQVFALLLLNRFIGENPFASEAGGISGETFARQSVSKILSQQLNNLAAELVSGIELNFDLESSEDYTTGAREQRTDLNVAVSKTLLNDRLKVSVGSNFGLEGPQQVNEQTNNIAGDLSAEYQLTRDGRYAVRAYRKNEYQMALQGQVIETGVAFIITMDYNQFSELFHRSKEEKRMLREERRKKREQKEAEKRKKEENDAKLLEIQNTDPDDDKD
ncbi:translocation/assembly module TamB domain-containing protein [Flavobacterium sp. MAH-1]|uniref:Translocation/assembly module TamB domain-containing protein n=1 Tax=Flavobacterium agri TaxID=2743471 RepID=A0A7Y8Y040_9FLAO|nr:translocation/assembly module TamB domain-containing protein [Flavobacterium agri]NUY79483.1 translocation/assembly module TamB domain-containing protein [Flavobacterium agri]NYA69508.1 translocation/assembly module TamB domain-containing protein [Flavobacterium agri]